MPPALRPLLAAALAAGPAAVAAQPAPARPDAPPCAYDACALAIAPTLTSLDVVRGADARRVARLGFFWASDVRAPFAGDPAARALAARATRTRRGAALLTDAGLGLVAAAAVAVARAGEVDRTGAALGLGGAALLGVSFPLQLRADAHLSRAVWVYNARFARPAGAP